MQGQGAWSPLLFVVLFIASSLLMIWALEAMNAGGLEGTVLGTLITPYCTGIGNLLVAFVIGRNRGSGTDVMTKKRNAIEYSYEELPRGGAVVIKTKDPEALKAIADFLAAQRTDHHSPGMH